MIVLIETITKSHVMKRSILLLAFAFALITGVQAQALTLPQASPKGKVMQTIGITDAYLVYHRPAVNDREIWGTLVPYDQVWRTGANQNTVISFSDNVMIEGQKLHAGKYGLHMIPGEEKWTVIFSNNHTSWGSFSYNPAEDALRVEVTPKQLANPVEMLTFSFENVTPTAATCVLSWNASCGTFPG